jgi:hypothetical protein
MPFDGSMPVTIVRRPGMEPSQHHRIARRFFAVAFACVAVQADSVRAEPIIFSKPDVPLAAPAKEEEGLPELRGKRLDMTAPAIEQPGFQQQQTTVVRTRRQEADPEENLHWLLRDPSRRRADNFKEQAGSVLSLSQEKERDKEAQRLSNPFAPQTDPTANANPLAPIQDLNWNARSETESRRGTASWRSSNKERGGEAQDSTFEREQAEPVDPFRSPFSVDAFSVPLAKEKPTAFQIEQRAAFERMINPSMVAPTRSLDPVSVFDAPRTLPSYGSSLLAPSRSPLVTRSEPVAPERVAPRPMAPAPVAERRATPPPTARSLAQTEDPRARPLIRQPTINEIPSRRF